MLKIELAFWPDTSPVVRKAPNPKATRALPAFRLRILTSLINKLLLKD
jgi:hypothetical protein